MNSLNPDLARLVERQRHAINRKFAERHPQIAATERALRKEQERAVDRFGHKRNGTVETHAKAATVRQGTCARLYMAGTIDAHQLGAASEIAAISRVICAGLGIRTVSLETRVDGGGNGQGQFWEALGRVRAEYAYTGWRAALTHPRPVLAVIVDDLALSVAARRYRMRQAGLKTLLIRALDAWADQAHKARSMIDEGDLLAAQAGVGVSDSSGEDGNELVELLAEWRAFKQRLWRSSMFAALGRWLARADQAHHARNMIDEADLLAAQAELQ